MNKVIFVSYASGTYKKNVFWNKLFVNVFMRPDTTLFFTDEDLKGDFIYEDNREIFDAKVGAGFWAWKPWAISKAMESANEGDIVIYQDCGEGLRYKNIFKPANLIAYAEEFGAMPGVLVPEHGSNRDWTHESCFRSMGCYSEEYFNIPQVEAVISVWKVSDKTRSFVAKWQEYCLVKEVISDDFLIEGSEFGSKGHRYDQSVLTNCVLKWGFEPYKNSLRVNNLLKSVFLLDILCGGTWLGRMFVCSLIAVRNFKKNILDLIKC